MKKINKLNSNGIVVVSSFDGCSGGQQALERLGITIDTYYAYEIDKYAMQVTMANYPNTIQLGSIVDADVSKLNKIPNLFIGGSPCQSFSFAGKRNGMSTKDNIEILTLEHYLDLKNQNFEFEGQSYLFWEYMRVLTDIRKINPDVKFLLENVMMGEKWQKILTRAIGINPIEINSATVSAQNRRRLYWTNIGAEQDGLFGDLKCMIPQPKDRNILLKDIIESKVDDKYFLSDKMLNGILKSNPEKALCITASYAKGTDVNTYLEKHSRQIIVHNTMPRSSKTGKGGTGPLSRNDGKTYCLDTGQTNAIEVREVKQLNSSLESGGVQPYQQNRVYDVDGISPAICAFKSDLIISGTLRTHNDGKGFREVVSGKGATIPARAREDGSGQNIVSIGGNIRRLTPLECERLQTMKDGYTAHVSDSQRYKMIGNG